MAGTGCTHPTRVCVHTPGSQTPTHRLRGGQRSGTKLEFCRVLWGPLASPPAQPVSLPTQQAPGCKRSSLRARPLRPPKPKSTATEGGQDGASVGPGAPALSVPRELFQKNLQPTQEPSPASSLHCLTASDCHGHPAGRRRHRDRGAMLGHPTFTTRPAHLQVPSLVLPHPGPAPSLNLSPDPPARVSAAPVPGASSPLTSWVLFPKTCSNWSNFISRTGPHHTPDYTFQCFPISLEPKPQVPSGVHRAPYPLSVSPTTSTGLQLHRLPPGPPASVPLHVPIPPAQFPSSCHKCRL